MSLEPNSMVHSPVRLVLGTILLAPCLVLGARGVGQLPAIGPLLDPANGVLAAGLAARADRVIGPLRGLDGPVDVVIDRRGVPHVFATSETDAHRVLGYLTARDRLFQLELQTRAASGRLSEWIGEPGLEADRLSRRLGFPRLVERSMAELDTLSAAYRAVSAYAGGINDFIDHMRPADLPLEYRFLGTKPEPWRLENTFYLLGRLGLDLAFNDPSLTKARAAARVGWAAADALFPVNTPIQEPIQPNRADGPRFAFDPIPVPSAPAPDAERVVAVLEGLHRALGLVAREPADVTLGSNNWAVSPARSATGHALLAGDPHLGLTLPSIWYQAHLVVPGRLDVQGVTLPGAPWVVIGFNRDIAWSFTNTGSDVTDYYRETVDAPDNPGRYRVDDRWRPLQLRVESYLDARGDTIAVDTMRFTHRGPLLRVDSTWTSLAWTLYDRSQSAEQFLAANRARTVGEFLEVMASYVAPAQNMLVADRRGTIAIRSTGRFPTRPGSGRGDLIQDGGFSASDWTGSLPAEFYPFAINPPRGFLSSANQQPVDPLVNRHYLGADWPSPWRALRINELLREDSSVTVEAMRRYQVDPTSARAKAFLPFLLGTDEPNPAREDPDQAMQGARAVLAEWDGAYDRANRHAVLFELVMREMASLAWDEFDTQVEGDRRPLRPGDAMLLSLLHDPTNPWWDVVRTPNIIETRDDVVSQALAAAFKRARADYGDPVSEGWRWDAVHQANIHHLLRIPALSALQLPVDGGPATLSPSSGSGTAGPSWRMVVELGPVVTAWATYPGGQSGNPASPHYDDLLPAWLDGRLDSLITPSNPAEVPVEMIEALLRFGAQRR